MSNYTSPTLEREPDLWRLTPASSIRKQVSRSLDSDCEKRVSRGCNRNPSRIRPRRPLEASGLQRRS